VRGRRPSDARLLAAAVPRGVPAARAATSAQAVAASAGRPKPSRATARLARVVRSPSPRRGALAGQGGREAPFAQARRRRAKAPRPGVRGRVEAAGGASSARALGGAASAADARASSSNSTVAEAALHSHAGTGKRGALEGRGRVAVPRPP